jgi:glycogen operon protein
MATLLLSQGVPMICGGDELSHTQNGNNNAYCQDNDLTWLNWELNDEQKQFLDFVRELTRIRKEQPVFRRRRFFQGKPIRGTQIKDISWFQPSGEEMSDDDWAGFVRCLGVRLAGDQIDDVNERGEPIIGDTLMLLLNAHHEPIPFTLPVTRPEHHWETIFDTADPALGTKYFESKQTYQLNGRSTVLLRARVRQDEGPVSGAQVETLRRESRPSALPRDEAVVATAS